MTYTIAAKPTLYKGTIFRSRLEAKWARAFDLLELPYIYEPQGYLLDRAAMPQRSEVPIGLIEEDPKDHRPYVPDFYLPTLGAWVEVKGSNDMLDYRLMAWACMCLPTPGEPQSPDADLFQIDFAGWREIPRGCDLIILGPQEPTLCIRLQRHVLPAENGVAAGVGVAAVVSEIDSLSKWRRAMCIGRDSVVAVDGRMLPTSQWIDPYPECTVIDDQPSVFRDVAAYTFEDAAPIERTPRNYHPTFKQGAR